MITSSADTLGICIGAALYDASMSVGLRLSCNPGRQSSDLCKCVIANVVVEWTFRCARWQAIYTTCAMANASLEHIECGTMTLGVTVKPGSRRIPRIRPTYS
jgi:hypothetical protein